MGVIIRSAIHAANGMPAVSPPATASIDSYPTCRMIFSAASAQIFARARGK